MEEGAHAAQDTSQSMLAVVAQADEMGELIDGIADYTQQQSANTQEITAGIEQISNVVQTNTANSEESAAVSAELFEQVNQMQKQTSRFKLKH